MMNYFLSDEQIRIKELAEKITKEAILPVRERLDAEEEFPTEIIQKLKDAEMFKLFIPKEYGGFGMGTIELCLVVEEFSRGCAGVGTTYAANALAATPIILFANENQKNKYLSKIANGVLASFALTEPDAGSDAGAVKMRALKDGDFYILDGTKQWISNGGEAEIYTVFTSTKPDRGARGMSAFIVEKGTAGFSFGKLENKLGIRASCTRELIFENCKVPAENLLGKEGIGFIIAMRTFDYTRPGVGALSVGIAQGAIDELINYAKGTKRSMDIFEGIAELVAKVEAARSLVLQVAKYTDSGAKDSPRYSAMAKLFASDVAMEVTGKVIEIFGTAGCIRRYAVEKMYRDAKITQIYEGTNEIQKLVIASYLAK